MRAFGQWKPVDGRRAALRSSVGDRALGHDGPLTLMRHAVALTQRCYQPFQACLGYVLIGEGAVPSLGMEQRARRRATTSAQEAAGVAARADR